VAEDVEERRLEHSLFGAGASGSCGDGESGVMRGVQQRSLLQLSVYKIYQCKDTAAKFINYLF